MVLHIVQLRAVPIVDLKLTCAVFRFQECTVQRNVFVREPRKCTDRFFDEQLLWWAGAGVGIGMLRGAGDSFNSNENKI